MNNLKTVIGFTFGQKVRTKAFIVTTVILLVLLTIGVNLPYIISMFDKGEGKKAAVVGMIKDDTEIAASLKKAYDAQKNADLKIVLYDSTGSAKDDEAKLTQEIAAKKIKAYLLTKQEAGAKFPSFVYKSEDSIGMSVNMSLHNTLQTVKTEVIIKDTLTPEQKNALNAPIEIKGEEIVLKEGSDQTQSVQSSGQKGAEIALVMVVIVLFFMTLQMTGNMIASEVTSEKSSRIMEILITSVSPLQQMFGKIIGMFLVGLTQIVVIGATIAVNLMLPHNQGALANYGLDLTGINWTIPVYGLIFYVLGFFLYATLYAAVGSMISRTEELGQAVLPVTMVSLVAFYISTFSISSADSMLVKVTSYIPFFSPTSMLLRIGLGKVATWEIMVSLAILLVSIFAFGWLSAKIYRTGVLMYGKRPTWKELRKAMKAYKI